MVDALRAPLPPHHVYRDFLPPDRAAMLLDWTLGNRSRFKPSTVTDGTVKPERRKSERLCDLGPAKEWFDETMRATASDFFAKTGTAPFEIEFVELEIAAHGDVAHFATHTDIPVGWGRAPLGGDKSGTQDRLLSAVYYFHRRPKRFSDGQLRLHRFGSNNEPGDFVDIEPEHNSLLVFPSWVTHEVRTVRCPSKRFEDYRFAVNCWLCRTLKLD